MEREGREMERERERGGKWRKSGLWRREEGRKGVDERGGNMEGGEVKK